MAMAAGGIHSLLLCAAGQVCADCAETHVRQSASEDSLRGAQDRKGDKHGTHRGDIAAVPLIGQHCLVVA